MCKFDPVSMVSAEEDNPVQNITFCLWKWDLCALSLHSLEIASANFGFIAEFRNPCLVKSNGGYTKSSCGNTSSRLTSLLLAIIKCRLGSCGSTLSSSPSAITFALVYLDGIPENIFCNMFSYHFGNN